MVHIRKARKADLHELVEIENICFVKEEAATKESFEKRIHFYPDSFFVAEENGELVGLVNGPVIEREFITDDLFSNSNQNPQNGGHQSVLGLAVAPKYQKRGIASALLSHLEQEAKAKKRKTITLTCKEKLIPFYEKQGYENCGISSSQHGGVVWYNMVKNLS